MPTPVRAGQPLPDMVTDPPRVTVLGEMATVALYTVKAMLALFGGEAASVTMMVVAPAAVPFGTLIVKFTCPSPYEVSTEGVTTTLPSFTVRLEFAAKLKPTTWTELVGLA